MLSHETYIRPSQRSIEAFKAPRDPSRRQPKKLPSFQTIRKISKAKFSVYLIFCESLNQHFAMKVFPFKDDKVNPYFSTEIKFAGLDHPNIVKIVSYENARETLTQGERIMVSYLVMEYAPYGDFYDIVAVKKLLTDDKLVRTYFRQLIEGIQYLHSNKIAHLDLKLENLLMGKDFNLKIADFDLAYVKGDSRVNTKGTKFYRAPELLNQKCRDTEAADMYAAGVVLFVFKTAGILPHSESQLYKGMNLFKLLSENNKVFWQRHCEIQEKPSSFFDADFRSLFNSLTAVDPRDRATLEDVKKSKWYNGPVYTQDELVRIMKKAF